MYGLNSRRICFLHTGSLMQSGSAVFPGMSPPISAGYSSRGARAAGQKARLYLALTTGNIMEQTDLFRLTQGLEADCSQQWLYHVLNDTEWLRLRRQNIKSVCLRRVHPQIRA